MIDAVVVAVIPILNLIFRCVGSEFLTDIDIYIHIFEGRMVEVNDLAL